METVSPVGAASSQLKIPRLDFHYNSNVLGAKALLLTLKHITCVFTAALCDNDALAVLAWTVSCVRNATSLGGGFFFLNLVL